MNKLRQLILESIGDYIREIDETGNMAALEAKIGKTQEAIELREKKMNMDGLDEAYHDMLDKTKIKELGNEVKALKKSLTKYEKQLEKLKSKADKSSKVEKEEEKEIVDEAFSNENNEDELILAYNRSPKVVSWDTIEKKYQESGLTGEEFFADYENEFRNQFEGKPVSKEAYFNFYADRATGGQDDRYTMENWIDLTNQESDDMNIYEVLYMQKLAGIISESEYVAKINEVKKKASAGMTKKEKSAVAKKAHAGKDIGKKGKGFEKVAKAAEKQYGSKEAGKKVAAAAMWKAQAKK